MMQEWLGKVVGVDDPTRHDKWLCMMTPRLKALRELLREDGVIFVSTDNNEHHRLRSLLDEVFGERNFVGEMVWRKKEGGGQTDLYFVTEHEIILIYSKSDDYEWLDEIVPTDEAKYNKNDENGKFTAVKLAKWGSGARREDRPKMYFPIKDPDGKNAYPKAPDGSEGRWRVGKARMELLVEKELIHWEKKNGDWIPYEKFHYEKGAVTRVKERSILFDIATTGDASNVLTEIFGKKDVFENPKPVDLVKLFIERSTRKDAVDIILDSFAGSGTTAHAVLDLNKEDGGNRKFILIECEDYADSITAERIRRVIKGVPTAKDETLKQGLGCVFR
jgi:adenine-specific DNA-methyltransferase